MCDSANLSYLGWVSSRRGLCILVRPCNRGIGIFVNDNLDVSISKLSVSKMSSSGDCPTTRDASKLPPGFQEAVLKSSQPLPEGVNVQVRGYDFNKGIDFDQLMASYASTGFQATHFGRAVDVINAMVSLQQVQIMFLFFSKSKGFLVLSNVLDTL